MEKVLPKGWVDFNISTLVNDKGLFSDGDWVESKDQDPDGEVRLIQLADIGINDFRNKSNRFIKDDKAKELKCTFINKNDVLIARMPDPIGRACIFPLSGKYVTVVDVAIVRFEQKYFNHKLFSYFVNSPEIGKQISNLASGSTRQRISRKNLDTILFPLPPLAEQERIVTKLDALFAQHEVIKKALERIPQLLKDFRQQVLNQAVTGKLTEQWRGGKDLEIPYLKNVAKYKLEFELDRPSNWAVHAVGNIFSFQQGMQIAKSSRLTIPNENTLPILRIKNYHDGFTSDVEYIETNEKSLIAQADDIILTRTGESRGWVLTGFKGVFHNNTFRVNYPKEYFYQKFVQYQLSCLQIQNYIKTVSGRTGQPDLTHKMFGPCPFNIPSLQEQQEIVRRVESFFAKADVIESRYQTLKEKIDSLPQAILHKAFIGELVPQLPTDGDAKDLLAEIVKLKEEAKPKKGKKK